MSDADEMAELAEAQQLRAQIARLEIQINRAYVENQNLQAELATLIENVEILTANAESMGVEVNESMDYLKGRVKDADLNTGELFALIDDLTNSYFTFKNLSTASKNVTQFTDEYFTKFKFFNELRRITLGYVIGLDAHICSDESLRKKVEKVYLQNTEYWLAYAIMAVMLWKENEKEAAERAMAKSLSMDYYKTALFFLLINLRFTRIDAAKKWYLSYLDRVDTENLNEEWQYLLQSYLSGVFGIDREFSHLVNVYFNNMLGQMESMHPNYGNQVAEKASKFSNLYIYVTKNEFESLRRYSPDYEDLKSLLSDAEKNEVLADHFRSVLAEDTKVESDLFQRIENILYDLINEYDKDELKVIKNKRYNEMILRAQGDLGMAQQYYNNEFPENTKSKKLEDLLFQWAFEEDSNIVDPIVKKFSLNYLKKWIAKGFKRYADDYRKKEKEKIRVEIDGWTAECDENSYDKESGELRKHYNKNRVMDTIKDKYVVIFILMCVAALATLIITILVSVSKRALVPVPLVIGILLGAAGGILLWRRITELQVILKTKRENACALLKKVLDEFGSWKEMYRKADEKNADLVSVFDKLEE